jgi:acyl-CoA thioesterase
VLSVSVTFGGSVDARALAASEARIGMERMVK